MHPQTGAGRIFLIIPVGCAIPYGGSWADRTGAMGVLRVGIAGCMLP
jgi:hypothetical protein